MHRKVSPFRVLLMLAGLLAALPSAPRSLPAQEASAAAWKRQGPRQLRRAFRDVSRDLQKSTVRILSDTGVLGYGTVVESDGWILTKASQVSEAVEIELADGRRFPLEIMGTHTPTDLLLAKIEATDLIPVKWDHTSPAVGTWLISPDTEGAPLSVGVISLERRKVDRSNVKGYLGIELEEEDGAKIRRVLPNSGASAAGLQQGDLVLKVNDEQIASSQQLVRTIGSYRPGDTLMLHIRREEEEIPYSVTLTHPFGELLSRIAFQNQLGGELSFRRDDFPAVYQHDSVLKPEECGGPVVTLDGAVLGINIARAGRTASFLLPGDLILEVLEELKGDRLPASDSRNDSELTMEPMLTDGPVD